MLTLQSTATIQTVDGTLCRIWEGRTDTGVPVKAWIATVQPQTHDAQHLETFERELLAMPYEQQLVSIDLRMMS